MARNLMDAYPAIADLEARASKRIPHFAWEYLVSGTGTERARDRNIESLQEVTLVPQLMKGVLEPDISVELFGINYDAPIGIAPIGLTGLIWPGADVCLAKTAATKNIPYTLSTVATERPEVVGPVADGRGWFQLYPPRDRTVRDSILDRAERAGFNALVVTADVPIASRRERQRKAQIRVPPTVSPELVFQSLVHPAWTIGLARYGLPRFRTLEPYIEQASMKELAGFVGASLGGTLSFDYLAEVRHRWSGPLVIKGILDPSDAQRSVDVGVDAVQVSNHGGRQLDAAPAAIEMLASVVDRVGAQVPVLFDGGVRSGLDVARAIAMGASFVFCGRAFMFGLGALGAGGAEHAYEILVDDLRNVMHQTGCSRLDELPSRLRIGI